VRDVRFDLQSTLNRQPVSSPRVSFLAAKLTATRAVSEIFWERVKETVVSESKEVALALRRKENEWKNTYPSTQRHSRCAVSEIFPASLCSIDVRGNDFFFFWQRFCFLSDASLRRSDAVETISSTWAAHAFLRT
jgi:hypothetical protein